MKYYAVRKGRKPGIYTSWDECKKQTLKFPGAVYKSFENEVEAKEFMEQEKKESDISQFLIPLTAYTDGSYDPHTKRGGWGYILLDNGEPCVKAYGPSYGDLKSRNIMTEIEAAKEAINKAHELGADYLRIYHDYEGIGRWANGDWSTNNAETLAYAEFVRRMRDEMTIEFEKVKGHSSDALNNEADELANKGVNSNKRVEIWCGEMAAEDNIEIHETEVVPPAEEIPFFEGDNAESDESGIWEQEMQMPDEEPDEPYFEADDDNGKDVPVAEATEVIEMADGTGIETVAESVDTSEVTKPTEAAESAEAAEDTETVVEKKPPMPFHLMLIQMREAKMLTKSGVAKATGCSQYARMESGEDIKITRAILRNIYDALHKPDSCSFAAFVAAWANS